MSEPADPATGRPDEDAGGGRTFTVVAVVVTVIVLAAAAAGVLVLAGGGRDEPGMRVAPGGAIELADVPDHMAMHYRFAAAHPRAYRAVPCYCGCDDSLEHRYLLDCFLRPGGEWEGHAAGCAVCIQESEIVRLMLAEGASVDEIRTEIVGRYTMS
jgi:hypothetical protein